MPDPDENVRRGPEDPPHKRDGEKGSALLIVFVFAAVVAIMLYMEMPVYMFEAQRQKEQLLIDRGNEYAHAVKLYVRKFGSYPTSIDALENTNRMRFLRHRFKDPFTGKDDWRLLHAGPGGMLIDSKVNPLNKNLNGSTSGTGSSFGSAANAANSGFGTNASGFGNNSSDSTAEVVVPPIRQRPPAISAAGSGTEASSSGTVPPAGQNPLTPLLPTGEAQQDTSPGALAGQAAAQAALANGSAPGTTDANGNPLNNLLTHPNGATPQAVALGSTGSRMGTISGGGIAGVASKAEGHSIKTVNDQDDYSLWEFYYDPTKDPMRGGGQQMQMQTGMNQQNGTNSTNTSAFGPSSNTGTSGFGSSGFGSSGFGSTSGSTNSTPAPTTTPAPQPSQQQ